MAGTAVTTRLYDLPGRAVEKYVAWMLLHQGRKITKQDAVNELIVIGARAVLPEEILQEFGLEGLSRVTPIVKTTDRQS